MGWMSKVGLDGIKALLLQAPLPINRIDSLVLGARRDPWCSAPSIEPIFEKQKMPG